ncbi:MAG: ribosome-associated translation inhibitor RaiA [Candidatus Firestonebacteria bacterium]|nr:ribosome-associated translation inhibitor RaiA [Candidatus Firestonebacteria bacterium]
MKLIITGRQMEVTKGMAQYIRKRFGKLATFVGADAEVHVILRVEGYRHQAEVTAKSGPYAVAAKQITKDMYSSIDLLAEKAGQQLARQHDRLARKSGAVMAPAPKELVRAPKREAPAVGRIVEEEASAGKPMTPEEAALQLNGSRQAFMVFEDVHTGDLNVLVRRKDGNFKLIVKD